MLHHARSLAAATSTVRLSALVTGNTYRNPALLAKTVTTLDVVSGGRAILGIGAGWFALEHEALGFEYGSFSDRFAKLEEALQIIVPMLDGERPSFDGSWYHVREAINEPRLREHIPVMVGGAGRRRPSRWRRGSPTTSTSSVPRTSSPTRSPCSPSDARRSAATRRR